MLQQTTSAAVIPYYNRFLKSFPNLKSLANAQIEDVYEHWSGLGYYSRARNLHKCATELVRNHNGRFPKTHDQLIQLPGFGPYTSRAVSSIANGESVGVLDGNVIRVMSRYLNTGFEWWAPKIRNQMQEVVDSWVAGVKSADMNSALMELGATICLPQNPKCLLCPLMKSCKGRKAQTFDQLPLKKPKRKKEIWLWTAEVRHRSDKVFLVKNRYAPFLKNSWFPEGKVRKVSSQPREFDFRHTITHHEIFVRIKSNKANIKSSEDGKWFPLKDSRKQAPAALVQKALEYAVEEKT